MPAAKQDKIREQVTKAVDAIIAKKPLRIFMATGALSKSDPNKVLAELSIQVDEILDGADRDAVLAAVDLPDTWGDRRRIIDAVNANDHTEMFEAFNIEPGHPATLYSSLFTLAAALKVARKTI